jgi:hypothetical protein
MTKPARAFADSEGSVATDLRPWPWMVAREPLTVKPLQKRPPVTDWRAWGRERLGLAQLVWTKRLPMMVVQLPMLSRSLFWRMPSVVPDCPQVVPTATQCGLAMELRGDLYLDLQLCR